MNVLGFRNPMLAPLPMQVRAYLEAFENKDEVIPFSLSTWVKVKADLAEKVKSWLEKEGWEDCTLDRNPSDYEGFTGYWPEKLTYDKLFKQFTKEYPEEEVTKDDLILMVAWISGKLPISDSGL